MYNMIDNPTEELKIRRIKSAEKACRDSTTDWSKNYWYGVFSKLCKKYDRNDYFRKVIN